ncbi:lytic transglycosylase domain-containing protein [Mesobaculum littorinae]|uniref:Lytic transglycosylase domain-containing protein n=1 Tax=Mesobaculum littorinae TaxID=2486419 RepID=A0A438AKC3_9RHOB|nr:lytic transglycosylase domain-containing protein [Mesobaculum littorinae]RVV99271.1 lytic transglycosylase domain-containing protein [Mesobaculum littorinae]
MQHWTRRAALGGALAALAACGSRQDEVTRHAPLAPGATPRMRVLVDKWATEWNVPPALVHRVVQRESSYNPAARNGPYYGLMQIHPTTARTMGYSGPPEGLLDAETNLRYAVKYLRGAWMVSDGDYDEAVGWYSRGYYYEAKRRGLLRETGLRS